MSSIIETSNTLPICHKFLQGKCRGACKFRHELPGFTSDNNNHCYNESRESRESRSAFKSHNTETITYHKKDKHKHKHSKAYHNKNIKDNKNKYDKSKTKASKRDHRRLALSKNAYPLYVMYIGEFDDEEQNICKNIGEAVADCYEYNMPPVVDSIKEWFKSINLDNPLKFNASAIPYNTNPERSMIMFTFMLRSANAYLYHVTLPGYYQRDQPEYTEWCTYLFKRFCPKFPIGIDNVKFDDFKDLYYFTIYKMHSYIQHHSEELEKYMHHMMAMFWAIHSFCISNNILIPSQNKLDMNYINNKCATYNYYY